MVEEELVVEVLREVIAVLQLLFAGLAMLVLVVLWEWCRCIAGILRRLLVFVLLDNGIVCMLFLWYDLLHSGLRDLDVSCRIALSFFERHAFPYTHHANIEPKCISPNILMSV